MKNIRRIVCYMMILSMILGFAGGSAAPDTVSAAKVRSVKLNKKKLKLKVGKKYTLKAKLKPAGAKASFAWKSSNKKVAKVNKKGVVKALKEGSAKITVQVKKTKLKAVCKVTVSAGEDNAAVQDTATAAPDNTTPNGAPASEATPEPTPRTFTNPATAVKFNDNDYVSIEIGDSYELSTSLTPSDAEPDSVEFTSDRDWVASVDGTGKVTAEYPGMTIIRMTSAVDPSVTASIHVNVVDTEPAPRGFDQYNADIEHGRVVDLTYPTEYRDSLTQHALAWIPPNYSEDQEYNILFCLHGGNDNEYYWTRNCSGDKVLDAALANGVMEENTIVVFTSGVINYNNSRNYPHVPADAQITDWGRNHYLLEYEIIYDLLPFMIENYSVAEGKEHTAVCGLSMGGGQTLDIGLKNPDIFAYVGCFSAGPFASGDQKFVTCKEDADMLNEKLKFFTIMVGSEDHLGDDNVRVFERTCTQYEVNHLFVEEQGLNHEDACWNRNLYKFMKYAFK